MGEKIHVVVLVAMMSVMSKYMAQTVSSGAKNGCAERCGEVVVPYPFGIGKGCALSDDFLVECDDGRPKLTDVDLDVVNVKLGSGKIRLLWGFISYICNSSAVVSFSKINLNMSRYALSYKDNLFFAVGCNDTAHIDDTSGRFFGCTTTNRNISSADSSVCSGHNGCCQVSIPSWLTEFSEENVWDENKYFNKSVCSSIIMAERGNFTAEHVDQILAGDSASSSWLFPIVWDWVVEKITCDKATSSQSYACVSPDSKCVNSSNGAGYLCKCEDGHRGNPYLHDGCKDIDECSEGSPCPEGQTCINTNGSFTCSTKHGLPTYAKILIGVGAGLPVALLMVTWVYWILQKRKFVKHRESIFQQNGGLLLQQHISNGQENAFKIFSAAELEKATDKYSNERILGKGGFGTVYMGRLGDGKVAAIKKTMTVDESRGKEFAREMLILSQINHVNVVKLLGCCLEVEVPMLVYEFIPHGTLYHYIHHKRHQHPICWSIRLKIAAESAKALGYLHAEASPTILHGDIKSSNILLDENYTAKVSDFGTSTLAPKDRSKFMTVVQGTWGYLDPEYLQTCQLTEKSDVYSFGVVMAELLTGRKALYMDENGDERCLALDFNSVVKEGRLVEVLDEQLAGEETSLEQIKVVANIVVRCLSSSAEERPTMPQIYMELETLRGSVEHTWAKQSVVEMHYSAADQRTNYSNPSTAEYSNTNTENQRAKSLKTGR